jgi:hypothetical protein
LCQYSRITTFCMGSGTLLFLFYFLLFALLLKWLCRRKILAVSFTQVFLLFALKVILGSLYGYLFLSLYGGDDTWVYHAQGINEYNNLIQNPIRFVTDIFENNYPGSLMNSLFETNNSYWKSLEYTVLIKLLAIFNIFSRGEYFVNVILFSFLVMWGNYFLFKVFSKYFPRLKKILLLLIFFFLPFIFWTSGIRKDGVILLLLGISLYQFSCITGGKASWKNWVNTILAISFTYVIRNYVALMLIPALICWYIGKKYPAYSLKIFISIYLLFIFIFFASSQFHPSLNLPEKVARRQHEFIELSGGSYVESDTLQPTIRSYVLNFPQAAAHVFFRPYPFERRSLLFQGSALETYFCLTMFLISFIFTHKEAGVCLRHPFILACLFFSLSNYILIGYTVPFIGAIVRYKSIYEVLLLAVALIVTDWQRLKRWLGIETRQ